MSYATGLQIDQAPLWVIVVLSFAWILSSIWIVRDSLARGKNPLATLVFLTTAGWPLSILWWIYLRPNVKKQD
jgi:hypothetical protein